MSYIAIPFGHIMRFCYESLNNYGLAILLFTLITKVILFPVALWTQQNSVKLVKIQPQLNRIKAKYYGEKDKISDEQLALYKKEKYNPFIGMIPMVIQIFLLLCLIQIIYNPLSYILSLPKDTIEALVQYVCAATGLDAASNSVQLSVVTQIQNGLQVVGFNVESIFKLNMSFLGFDLSATPVTAGGKMLIVPLLAGTSSLLLSLSQNVFNPLQAQQGKATQWGTAAVSVGISLILGGFVPAGIGLYWIASNLFTILQQFVLNVIINPKKHVDYQALEESAKELEKIAAVGKKSSPKRGDKNYRRQKEDYKRFFSVANKHLVIYSENNGYYKYFERIIAYLLQHSNIVIHYVTSDANDRIFTLSQTQPRIKPYYISEQKMITLFMKMDADIVLMTMPDLDNFHYKRSYVKKDIEYIFTPHYPMSTHMVMNHGALDHFDTIFCVGDFQIPEIRKQEEIYHLPPKKLVVCGYGFLETLYDKYNAMDKEAHDTPKILIAPSWQEDNILDSCIDELLKILLKKGYNVYVRPHPEYIKRYRARLDRLLEKYADYDGDDLTFELDFSSSESVYNSDVLITDWSGIAYEFSLITLKPSVFIDTPPKINNKKYQEIGIEPLELALRGKIGKRYQPHQWEHLEEDINEMLQNKDAYAQTIADIRSTMIADFGNNGKLAGKYILQSLIEKSKKSKQE